MRNIPSVVDGQGRALVSGSIPDVPLAVRQNPMNIFERNSVAMQGSFYIKMRKKLNY